MTSSSSARTSSSILQVLTFFAFGGLIVATGYHGDIPLLIVFIAFALLIARPVAITLSFRAGGAARRRTSASSPGSARRAWRRSCSPSSFSTRRSGRRTLIFETAAFVILVSIVIHGLTDTLGARWIERRVLNYDALRSLLLLLAELGRGQHALLLQLAEPLEPIELCVVGMPLVVREAPHRRADPPPGLRGRAAARSRIDRIQSPRCAPGNSCSVFRLSASMPTPASAISSSVSTSWRVPAGGQTINTIRAAAAKTDQTSSRRSRKRRRERPTDADGGSRRRGQEGRDARRGRRR